MISFLKSLQEYVENINDRIGNINFNIVVLLDDNQVLKQINEMQIKSNITIAYEFFSPFDNENYFVFCFENTLILLIQNDILKIKQFLINSKTTIYSLPNTSDKIINLCKTLNFHFSFVDDLLYDEEIVTYIHELNLPGVKDTRIVNACKAILRCIGSFLINKAYLNSNINRIKSYYNNKDEFFNNKITSPYDYDTNCKYLKTINSTNSSCISLLYDDDNEQLIVKKSKTQKEKLYNREKQIYKDLKHPLISRYYGFYEDKIEKTLLIEFINGCTLSELKKLNLNDDEKYNIIFEILIVFQYLHSKGLIYRDLKPNNVMIDKNKIAVLIDFDQIITESRASNETLEKTNDFASYFSDPIIYSGNPFSYFVDIYSIGMLIYYIIIEDNPSIENCGQKIAFKKFPERYEKIEKIYKICIHENTEERPTIENLIRLYIIEILNNNHINQGIEKELVELLENNINNQSENPNGLYILGLIYFFDNYVRKDISKTIHYWDLASKKMHIDALNNLAYLYEEGKYVTRDTVKSLEYQKALFDFLYDDVKKNDRKALCFLRKINNIENYSDEKVKDLFFKAYESIQKKTKAYNNDIDAQYELGMFYLECNANIDEAIKYLSLAAKNNHMDAQMALGDFYFNPDGTRNINLAIYYYTLAANQNNSIAQFYLGCLYLESKYKYSEIPRAIYYLTRSANQNNKYAQYNLGNIYLKGIYVEKNVDLALYYLMLAAENNLPDALHDLGTIFMEAKEVPQDISKSIYYLEKSAKCNDSNAQCLLGIIYSDRKYKNYDINKAIYYYKLAIANNDLNAKNNLAMIYYTGNGVPKDEPLAYYYWSQAAEQNDKESLNNIALYHHNKNNTNDEIKYLELASKNNHSYSQNNLGMIYCEGKIIKRDINKGISYLLASASQNNVYALNNLGSIYSNGVLVPRNINKAIDYLRRAANKGFSVAQFNLANIYYFGKYVPFDIIKAINYYQLSSEQHYNDSTFNLAMIYYEGKYVKRNINKSIHCLKNASIYKYAKNNLGVIYKNGDGVEKNVNYAITYFNEAIDTHNDMLALFNLAHIYLFGELDKPDYNKSMDYLIKLSRKNKLLSELSLYLVITKKIKEKGWQNFENELMNLKDEEDKKFVTYLYRIAKFRTFEEYKYHCFLFDNLKNIDLIYTHSNGSFDSSENYIHKNETKFYGENINDQFYEGFGIE